MTSRYYNTNYYSSTAYASPYRSSRPPKSSRAPNDYNYLYYPPQQQQRVAPSTTTKRKSSSNKSPKAPRSPILGRRRPIGQWKQKKNQTQNDEDDKKETKGQYKQELVEAELAKKILETYKKGVFYHHDPEQRKKNKLFTEENGHPINNKIFNDMPRPVPPNYDERISKNGSKSNDDNKDEENDENNKKQSSSTKTKEISSSSSPQRRDRKSSSPQRRDRNKRRNKRSSSSKQQSSIVTVSPRAQRMGAAYSGYPGQTDYYLAGYQYPTYPGPPPARQGQPVYDDMYSQMAGYQYGVAAAAGTDWNISYSSAYPLGFGGSSRRHERGMVGDDGAWYPYPDVIDQEQYNQFITPKRDRKDNENKKDAVSANVDLTTPIIDGNRNKKKEKKKNKNKKDNADKE
eukprot:80419_1